ncbi:MAG: hypothetical protein IKX37_05030 [Bacteroidales bacterium]|nr:hypothetical protein [Bacteroidales bacterium]
MRKSILILLTALLLMPLGVDAAGKKKSKARKVYMTYVLHGNMNYDRYVRPVIWKEFPVIYDGLLDFMDAHPDFKGQLQFSGQTFGSMVQCAPEVIAHARRIHERGQLNFTGTFYSEPVNVNMDGETNFRCARLGTRIIEDAIGETDGFYLQERAYHPQLPWILNHSRVSWTPVITGEEDFFPFRLRGMDGSVSVCVPITRDDFIAKAKVAPKNALIAIEEDYEIPQTFTKAYAQAEAFNASQKEVQIEWITVKEYIQLFGLGPERYIDHSAKANEMDKGTYSRWTADPLDIVVQNETNRAMDRFRLADAADAFAYTLLREALDTPLDWNDITLEPDPLAWNIERADLYPEHEKYLTRRGETTLLSKADHLLLWAVNSDAKGWFPLYEKRRERMHSLQSSTQLSEAVLGKAADALGARLNAAGCEDYYLVFNLEAARKAPISLESDFPCTLYDLGTDTPLKGTCVYDGAHYTVTAEADLPAYGYTVIGTRRAKTDTPVWKEGNSVSNGFFTLTASQGKVTLSGGGRSVEMALDDFQLHALAHMDRGDADDTWRPAKEYGDARISICTDGLYPRLRIDRQPDWLVHFAQVYTLREGQVDCEITFDFPHPTVVRKEGQGPQGKNNFSPEGLDLLIRTGAPGTIGYDIPFGISEYKQPGTHWFCLLSSCFLQQSGGGWLLTPKTGEQAFAANLDTGELTLYLGASTTSGPIREMGLKYRSATDVDHDIEWYAEPFHGIYKHQFTLKPFGGTWQQAHLPREMRTLGKDVWIRRIRPSGTGSLPLRQTLLEGIPANVDVTSVSRADGPLQIRLNEREGLSTEVTLRIGEQTRTATLPPFGIVTL